MNFIMNH